MFTHMRVLTKDCLRFLQNALTEALNELLSQVCIGGVIEEDYLHSFLQSHTVCLALSPDESNFIIDRLEENHVRVAVER
jgi:hypothetical protein